MSIKRPFRQWELKQKYRVECVTRVIKMNQIFEGDTEYEELEEFQACIKTFIKRFHHCTKVGYCNVVLDCFHYYVHYVLYVDMMITC